MRPRAVSVLSTPSVAFARYAICRAMAVPGGQPSLGAKGKFRRGTVSLKRLILLASPTEVEPVFWWVGLNPDKLLPSDARARAYCSQKSCFLPFIAPGPTLKNPACQPRAGRWVFQDLPPRSLRDAPRASEWRLPCHFRGTAGYHRGEALRPSCMAEGALARTVSCMGRRSGHLSTPGK